MITLILIRGPLWRTRTVKSPSLSLRLFLSFRANYTGLPVGATPLHVPRLSALDGSGVMEDDYLYEDSEYYVYALDEYHEVEQSQKKFMFIVEGIVLTTVSVLGK